MTGQCFHHQSPITTVPALISVGIPVCHLHSRHDLSRTRVSAEHGLRVRNCKISESWQLLMISRFWLLWTLVHHFAFLAGWRDKLMAKSKTLHLHRLLTPQRTLCSMCTKNHPELWPLWKRIEQVCNFKMVIQWFAHACICMLVQ